MKRNAEHGSGPVEGHRAAGTNPTETPTKNLKRKSSLTNSIARTATLLGLAAACWSAPLLGTLPGVR